MNGLGLWITTLSGPSQPGGKLWIEVGGPSQAGSAVLPDFLGHADAPRLPVESDALTWHACGGNEIRASRPGLPQAAKIPGPDRPRPPGGPPWWIPAGLRPGR